MTSTKEDILQRVVQCFRTGTPTTPFPASDLNDTDAYAVQYALIERLKAQGEVVRGHKVALTTQAARDHLGVDEPCFGHILSTRVYPTGAEIPLSEYADSHCEAEVAFILAEDLKGPGVTSAQVMSAIRGVLPAIELVDIKVQGDGIRAADVIAHQALHGGVIIGSRMIDPATVDLQYEGVTAVYNGRLEGSGTGSEVMGNPMNPVIWLANKMAEFDDYLKAGEIVISGSVVTPVRVQPGSHINMTFTRLGSVGANFI